MKWNITTRLTLVFVLFATLIVVTLGILAYYQGREALQTAVESELISSANDREAALNNWGSERLAKVTAIANTPSFVEQAAILVVNAPGLSDAQVAHDRVVSDLIVRTGSGQPFLELFVLDGQSAKVIASTDPDREGKFKETMPYFINGKEKPYIQNVYYSISLQSIAMTVSAPIHAPDGQLLGVLAGRLNLEEMNEIINRRTGLHQTDEAFLVNTSNLFVTQPRLVADPAVLRRGIHTEAVNRCLEKNSGVVSALDYQNKPAVVAYRWLPERDVCLIVKLDQSEALTPARSLGRTIILFGVFTLIAASGLAAGLAGTITRPVLALRASVARFAASDLDARLPEFSQDELGQLAREFNHMAQALSEKEALLRQRAGQLEAANKELEAFSYSVSHDLRAPLRAIDGFSRLLLEDYAPSLDGEARRYLNIVRDNTQQMGRLIDDLLAFARFSRTTLEVEMIQLADLAWQVFAELKTDQAGRQVEIKIAELPVCWGDRALLKQVLLNLLSNALKFTRHKDVARIEIGCQRVNEEQVYSVKDNGAGFDMQYAGKLFGIFQRLHSSDQFEGTGIGLSIVQRIIHRHGSRIWAEAALDEGATFYFTLPTPERASSHEPEEAVIDFVVRAKELV